MKKIAGLLSIFFIIISLISACTIQESIKVVATVNDEEITSDILKFYIESIKLQMENEASQAGQTDMEKFWQTEIEGKKAVDIAKEKALEQAVNNKVQFLKAKELGLSLSEEDNKMINGQKGNMIKSAGSRKNYEEMLKQYGLTDKTFTKIMGEQFLISKLGEKILAGEESLAVTDQEMKDYYDSNKNSLSKIKAKHILFKTVDDNMQALSQEQQDEAKKKAEEVLNRIKAGEDFDTLMNEFSEDPGSKANPDGYIFGRNEMVSAFEEAAYALKPGEVSELVESEYGYHIIKREDLTLEDMKSNDAIETEIKINILTEKWKKDMDIKTNDKVLKQIKIN